MVYVPTGSRSRAEIRAARGKGRGARALPVCHLVASGSAEMLSLGGGGAKSAKPSFVSYVTPEVRLVLLLLSSSSLL